MVNLALQAKKYLHVHDLSKKSEAAERSWSGLLGSRLISAPIEDSGGRVLQQVK